MSNYISEKRVPHKRVGFTVNLLLKSRGVMDSSTNVNHDHL